MSPPRIRGGIGADSEYWRALEAGQFKIARCGGCDRWMWPAHFRCAACGSWEVRWEEVEPIGILYTWTRNHLVSDALRERRPDLPYVTGLVELPQAGGARVAGVLQVDAPSIGAPVRGRIAPPSEKSRGHATMVWESAGAADG